MSLILLSGRQRSTTSLDRQLVFPGHEKRARAKCFAGIHDQFADACEVLARTMAESCKLPGPMARGHWVPWDHRQQVPRPKGTCVPWTSAPETATCQRCK